MQIEIWTLSSVVGDNYDLYDVKEVLRQFNVSYKEYILDIDNIIDPSNLADNQQIVSISELFEKDPTAVKENMPRIFIDGNLLIGGSGALKTILMLSHS